MDGSSAPRADGRTSDRLASATALTSMIGTTLGPNGMDKMLIGSDGKVVVTNDGASILDRMEIDDPIGGVIERAAASQSADVGDGATTMVLLIGELLEAAESLLADGLHPTTVVDGYIEASGVARRLLRDHGIEVDRDAEGSLSSVAETAVTGRWDAESTRRFGELAVGALRAVDFDRSRLTVKSYAGGGLRDSERVDGIVVDMDASSTTIDSIETPDLTGRTRPKIAMIDDEIGVGVPDDVESARIRDPKQLAEFREYEAERRSEIVRTLRALDADVAVCQKSIDETVRSRLLRSGILSVERTRQDEFDAIARATGSDSVRSVDDLSAAAVGRAGSVERRSVGRTDTLVVSGCPGETRTSLLLRGGTPHVAREVERIVGDCLDVVQLARSDRTVLPGGGAAALAVSRGVSAYADGVSDANQLAVEAFADALEGVPRTLAVNAGWDPIDALSTLRTRHYDGDTTVGVGLDGRPREMVEAGVLEPYGVFDSALGGAVEVVSTLLRIDGAFAADRSDAGGRSERADESRSPPGADTGGYPWAIGH